MVELDERSQPIKIRHVADIEKCLGVGNLYGFINNTFFSNIFQIMFQGMLSLKLDNF